MLAETIKPIEEHKNNKMNEMKLPDLVYAIVVVCESLIKVMKSMRLTDSYLDLNFRSLVVITSKLLPRSMVKNIKLIRLR